MRKSVTAIVCARMTSDRLPGKCLEDVGGKPVLQRVVERLGKAESVADIIIATSDEKEDDPICKLAADIGIRCHRGDRLNVNLRMWEALHRYGSGKPYVFRAMSDQPFLDWRSLDQAVALMDANNWDFVLPLAFEEEPVYGAGLSPWSYRVWQGIHGGSAGEENEHVGMWLRRNLEKYDYGLLDLPHWTFRPYRLELDEPDDLKLIRAIHGGMKEGGFTGEPTLRDVILYLDKHPAMLTINSHVREKTGPYTSFTKAEMNAWRQDYAGRQVMWSDTAGLIGSIEAAHEADYTCGKCGGNMVALSVVRGKGDLRTRCIRCGAERVFYSTKQRRH